MEEEGKLVKKDDPFLPEEIIVNIVKRLPVKSLIRFQCVSKRWGTLLKTPFFIHHDHHSTLRNQNPTILLHDAEDDNAPNPFSLLDHNLQIRQMENPNLPTPLSNLDVLDYVNGLVCLLDYQIDPHPLFCL